MPDPEPLSRRGLLSLSWAKRPAPEVDAHRAELLARWEAGAPALLAATHELARSLCDVAGVWPGVRVLDVAAGDGAVAAEAARRGATVSACDAAPRLVEAGRARTAAEGRTVRWELAGVEALPHPDGAFAVVLSRFGAALEPGARRTARELVRVLEPGGVLVLASPARGSFLARVLALAGPMPAGVPSPLAWADEDVARDRLAAAAPGTDVEVRTVAYVLELASEADAWGACARGLGLPPQAGERFADLVTARSSSRSHVRIEERAALVLARREA